MTIWTALLIVAGIFGLWYFLLFKKELLAIPPYQNRCNQDCNQGRDCVCDKPESTEINPQATWPFPHGPKP